MKIKFIEHHGPKKTIRELEASDDLRERYEDLVTYGCEFHCETFRPSILDGVRNALLVVQFPGIPLEDGIAEHCPGLDGCLLPHLELLIRKAHRTIKNHES